jgi:hypothetical protein
MNKYKLRLTEKAEKEYIKAFLYYEGKQLGLGTRFEKELEQLLIVIEKTPLLFAKKYKHFHEPMLKHFPFLVVFEIIDADIIIQSIYHAKQSTNKK